MANTTPWRQVVTPHDNIKQGRVKQNDFAASLDDVLHQSGNPDYYDPVRFFNRTFLTGGLRQLAGEVVGRLTGQGDGDAVMQIQTPFGGGKTHTLITLYHLVKNGSTCFDHPALKEYWLERGWKLPPSVPVAAFDGNQVGVGAVEVEPGLSVQTMWGHLAWQLAGKAGYKLIQKFDAERVSPGGEDIDQVLKASGGGLIILDEVANYVETAAAVGAGELDRPTTLLFAPSAVTQHVRIRLVGVPVDNMLEDPSFRWWPLDQGRSATVPASAPTRFAPLGGQRTVTVRSAGGAVAVW